MSRMYKEFIHINALPLRKNRLDHFPTLGKAAFVDEMSVVIVRTVVIPNATLAGTASRDNQKETQERTTISVEGT